MLIWYYGAPQSYSELILSFPGVDVTANQDEAEDTDREIFQMELVVPQTEDTPAKWAFRTVDNTYWTQEPLGGIQATAKDRR